MEPALSGDSCNSCHSKGHSSHSSVGSVSSCVVPVEEMNLETLDFATLDFNKDGFVCSLRRQPKNTSSGPWSDFDTATPKFRWIIQPSVGRDSHSSISSRAAGFYIFGKDGRMEG